jgi:uncharacterized protein YjlB
MTGPCQAKRTCAGKWLPRVWIPWSNGPGDIYGAHSHGFHKVIFVVSGSIAFGLPDTGERLHLHAGDRLDLPAGVRHDALVGPRGVACLEGHRPVQSHEEETP